MNIELLTRTKDENKLHFTNDLRKISNKLQFLRVSKTYLHNEEISVKTGGTIEHLWKYCTTLSISESKTWSLLLLIYAEVML